MCVCVCVCACVKRGGKGGYKCVSLFCVVLHVSACVLCCRTPLLLWPSFTLSSFSQTSSSVLSDLAFVSHSNAGYAHLQHRTFPLKSCVQTSHELSKISSTVSGNQEGDQGKTEVPSRGSASLRETTVSQSCDVVREACPQREAIYWTKLPAFLFSYSPKVGIVKNIL